MKYSVPIEGFTANQVEIETPGIFSGAKLLLNGQPAPKGNKRGQFVLRRDDGSEVNAKLKGMFLDSIPQVVVDDDKVIKVVEPLKWYQWLWAGLPILLIFMGGAIGAVFGVIATSFSARIYRSKMTPILQYLIVGVITVVAVVLYLIIATMISALL